MYTETISTQRLRRRLMRLLKHGEQVEGYKQFIREHGYEVKLLCNRPGVKFLKPIQLIKDCKTVKSFARWGSVIRWLESGEEPKDRNVIWVQGHRNTIERWPGSGQGKRGKVVVIKDTGERSPEFKDLKQAIRWLEIVPY